MSIVEIHNVNQFLVYIALWCIKVYNQVRCAWHIYQKKQPIYRLCSCL